MIRELENVGITLTMQSLDYNTVASKIANKDYNMFIGGYTWPFADMIWYGWDTARLPSPNRFWWGDNYTDAIIDNTLSFDDNVALSALRESQMLIAEDAAGLGLFSRGFVSAWSSSVKDTQWGTFKIHPIPSEWKFLDTYRASLPHAVSMSVYPKEENGSLESKLDYTVIVTNTGTEDDTYTFEVSDNAGWNPSISPSSLTLKGGEYDNAVLSVTIPADAVPCTLDQIIVTVTSQKDMTVSENTVCIAHAVAP